MRTAGATVVQVIVETGTGGRDGVQGGGVGLARAAWRASRAATRLKHCDAALEHITPPTTGGRLTAPLSTADGPLYPRPDRGGPGKLGAIMVYCMSRQAPSEWNSDVASLARWVASSEHTEEPGAKA